MLGSPSRPCIESRMVLTSHTQCWPLVLQDVQTDVTPVTQQRWRREELPCRHAVMEAAGEVPGDFPAVLWMVPTHLKRWWSESGKAEVLSPEDDGLEHQLLLQLLALGPVRHPHWDLFLYRQWLGLSLIVKVMPVQYLVNNSESLQYQTHAKWSLLYPLTEVDWKISKRKTSHQSQTSKVYTVNTEVYIPFVCVFHFTS